MAFLALRNLMYDAYIDWQAELVYYTVKELLNFGFEECAKILSAPYCNEPLHKELAGLAQGLQTKGFGMQELLSAASSIKNNIASLEEYNILKRFFIKRCWTWF